MSEWSWVALGFIVTYGSLSAYFMFMHRRRVVLRRQLRNLP